MCEEFPSTKLLLANSLLNEVGITNLSFLISELVAKAETVFIYFFTAEKELIVSKNMACMCQIHSSKWVGRSTPPFAKQRSTVASQQYSTEVGDMVHHDAGFFIK
jgi:hypothetical protein